MFLLFTWQAKWIQGQLTSLVPGMMDTRILGDIFHLNWGKNWNLFSFSDNCSNNTIIFFQRINKTKVVAFLFVCFCFGFVWVVVFVCLFLMEAKNDNWNKKKKSKASLQFPENILQASLQSGQLNCYSRNGNLRSKQWFPYYNTQTESRLVHSQVGR